jgi:hypothetical protein
MISVIQKYCAGLTKVVQAYILSVYPETGQEALDEAGAKTGRAHRTYPSARRKGIPRTYSYTAYRMAAVGSDYVTA